jgi:hypothetical protein
VAHATNSPIELKGVLATLLRDLPGHYDNAPQVFFESEYETPPAQRHPREHRAVLALSSPALGEGVLLSTVRRGPKSAALDERETRVWTLAIDAERRAVRMVPWQFRETARFAPAAATGTASGEVSGFSSLTRADLTPAEGPSGCTLWWRLVGNQLVGESDPTACVAGKGRDARRWDWQWVLTSEELWSRYTARDSAGRIVAESPGGSHVRLGKERDFECLFGYRPPDGPPVSFNGARMRDRGDTLVWEPRSQPARKFHYELIRGMWPSNSGRNFEDLLRLYMYEGDPASPPESRRLLGVGWASADSDRASFGDGVYSGRCKLYDPKAPPARNE